MLHPVYTQVGTGAAGFMAIRVLLDHGVNPAHIIFVTFLVARSGGVAHLRRTFPDVNIVTGAVDDGLREVWLENAERHVAFPDEDGFDNAQQHKAWVVEPGMGQIGKSPVAPPSMCQLEYFLQAIGTISVKPHVFLARRNVHHSTDTSITVSRSVLGRPCTSLGLLCYYCDTSRVDVNESKVRVRCQGPSPWSRI